MREAWDRLNKSSKTWIIVSIIILFGLFQTGGVYGYHPPIQGFKIASRLFASSPPIIQQVRALGWTFERNFNKGTEEKLYLEYANLFLGEPADIETFREHRGDLGPYEALMLPKQNDGPQIPYINIGVEYPPLNIPFVIAPRLLSGQEIDYFTLFNFQMGAICFVILLGGLWFSRNHFQSSPEQDSYFLKMSALALLGLSHLFTTRLDILLNLTLLATFVAVIRHKAILGGILLALATATKLFPLLLVPLFTAYFWINTDRRDSWRFCLSWTLCTALLFVPWAIFGGERFWVMLWFHGDRPIQVESTYSSLVLLKQVLSGQQPEIGLFQGSFNVITPLNPFFRSLSTIATLVTPLLILFTYIRAARTRTDVAATSLLLRAVVAFLVLLMVVSKVLSPQYLIWIWPVIFLIRDPDYKAIHFLALVATVSTQFVYPYFYPSLVAGQAQGIFVLAFRNFTLVFLGLLLITGLWSQERCEKTAGLMEKWFSAEKRPSWTNSAMVALVALQFLGKVSILWPQHVFSDQDSSALGALAFNLSRTTVGCDSQTLLEIGPLPAFALASLLWFGMDSVTAGLGFQLGGLALLAITLAATLRRFGLSWLFVLGLSSLLFAGGMLRSLLYQLSAFSFAAVLNLVLFNIILTIRQRPGKTWMIAGAVALVFIVLCAPTISGAAFLAMVLFFPIGRSIFERLCLTYSLFLTLSVFLALKFSRTMDMSQFEQLGRLHSADLILTTTVIFTSLVLIFRRESVPCEVTKLYFLSTLLTSATLIVLLGLEPARLLELKVCSLLVLGKAKNDRSLVKLLGTYLPIVIVILLILPNPFGRNELPPSAVTRSTVQLVHDAIRIDSRPIQADNSFVLTLLSDAPIIFYQDKLGYKFLHPHGKALQKKVIVVSQHLTNRWKDIPRLNLFLNPASTAFSRQYGTRYNLKKHYPPFAVYSQAEEARQGAQN